jgi:hypothetical protein
LKWRRKKRTGELSEGSGRENEGRGGETGEVALCAGRKRGSVRGAVQETIDGTGEAPARTPVSRHLSERARTYGSGGEALKEGGPSCTSDGVSFAR